MIDSATLTWVVIILAALLTVFGLHVESGSVVTLAGLCFIIVGIVLILPTMPAAPTDFENNAWTVTAVLISAGGVIEMFYGAAAVLNGEY